MVIATRSQLGAVGASYDSGVILIAAPVVQRSRGDRAEQRRRRIGGAFVRQQKTIEAAFLRPQKSFWATISTVVMARVRAAGRVGFQVDDIFVPSQFANQFARAMRPAWNVATYSGVQFEADWIGSREAKQSSRLIITQADEFEPPPSFAVDLSAAQQKRIKEWLKQREVGVWSKVGDTVHDRLRRAIERSIKEGESFDRMQERIQNVLTTQGDYAARRIARTEATGSLNFGQQVERDDIGIEAKEWVSTIDGRTRGADPGDSYDHLAADGQTAPNDGEFSVSGQKLAYPCDGSHGASAGNIVNCRCTSVASFDDTPPSVPKPPASPQPAAAPQPPATPQPPTPPPAPPVPPAPPKPKLTPVEIARRDLGKAKTIAEATEHARLLDLAENVNYRGVTIEVANSMNAAIADALNAAPDLRQQMKFVGTIDGSKRHYISKELDRIEQILIQRGASAADIKWMKERERKRLTKEINDYYRDATRSAYAVSVGPGKHPINNWLSGIAVNEKVAGDVKSLEERLLRNVQSNWHPLGTSKVRSLFDHEMAHQFDALLGLNTKNGKTVVDADLKKLIDPLSKAEIEAGLSRYANEGYDELVAEAWAEYKNNPKPRKIATDVGRLIESKLAARRAGANP